MSNISLNLCLIYYSSMQNNLWLNKQLKLPSISVRKGLILVVVYFLLAVGVSIFLSNDPDWGRWHISYLGEGSSTSAHFFNASMMVGGFLFAWFSLLFHGHLVSIGARAPKLITASFLLISACIYLIGLFPRSVGILPHDIFGHTIYFAFLVLCLATPWALPGQKRWFYIVSYLFYIAMLALFVMYWTGVSASLYLAEAANFVFFVGWTALLLSQEKVYERLA